MAKCGRLNRLSRGNAARPHPSGLKMYHVTKIHHRYIDRDVSDAPGFYSGEALPGEVDAVRLGVTYAK